MSEEPELVCVRTCQGWDLAQIFKSKLEAAEIPVLLEYDSAGRIFGLTVDGLGAVRIMVPKEYASTAESLLTDLPDDEPVGPSAEAEPPADPSVPS